MANKITERVRFETLMALDAVKALPDDYVGWLQKKIDQLDKKRAAGRTDANAEAKAELRDAIVAFMTGDHKYRVSEIMAGVPCPEGLNSSTSMFTSRLGELEEAGTVTSEKIKGVNYYSLA